MASGYGRPGWRSRSLAPTELEAEALRPADGCVRRRRSIESLNDSFDRRHPSIRTRDRQVSNRPTQQKSKGSDRGQRQCAADENGPTPQRFLVQDLEGRNALGIERKRRCFCRRIGVPVRLRESDQKIRHQVPTETDSLEETCLIAEAVPNQLQRLALVFLAETRRI